jgi:O-antigen/teichoic acid export membrane protein
VLALTSLPQQPTAQPRPDSGSLRQRSLSALFWGGGGTLMRIALQLGTQIALARMLGPAQFGLFAIGAVVVGFANFFSDVGIAYSLIQKPQVSPLDLRFVFTWQVVLGLLVTACVALLSGPIAGGLGDPLAQPVVAALAVVCLINALMAPALNLLKRTLDFKRIQAANLLGYGLGNVLVGIPMALAGAEVWALVAAWLVQACVTLLVLYGGARHPLRPLFWFDGGRQIVGYGSTVLATNITNWLIGSIERVVIARLFAAREVGLYTTAYNLLFSPVAAVLGVVQPVFFAAGSRVAVDPARIVRNFLALTALAAALVLPVFASIAAIAPTFVAALYGPAWHDAAPLVVPLAWAMPLYLLWGLATPLLWLGGAPGLEFRIQFPLAALWVAVAWLAAHQSVPAVAWAVLLLFGLRYALVVHAARRLLPLPWGGLWRALRGALLLAAVCATCAHGCDAWLTHQGVAAPLRLAADAAVGALVLGSALSLVPGLLPAECDEVLVQLATNSPPPLARWLHRLRARG